MTIFITSHPYLSLFIVGMAGFYLGFGICAVLGRSE